ncbi:Cell-division-associated, ABC-transporter-like signaling protein FtsX [hydrothermal vent metagenome]|uniref:Cell division protein FtsX n=1 Tax=hydrothermal vent metagenome TaxID=652676 RepID=A0A3B1A761_9ZZZZ
MSNSILNERAIPTLYGPLTNLKIYLLRHLQVFFYTLGKLLATPFATFLTAAVIGIALALPSALHVMLENVQHLSSGWDGATHISLFLKRDTSDTSARQLQTKLQSLAEVSKVQYISKEKALEEFKRLSGYGDVLKALKKNPLPSVLIVQPSLRYNTPEQSEKLLNDFQKLSYVDFAQLDMQWLRRLNAILGIIERGVTVMSVLLALAVTLVVGNTIRLAIQSRRDEIIIIKLIGGTNSFIRRPFLYTGAWYGVFGGIIAFVLVNIAVFALSSPITNLTNLYQSSFSLQGLGFIEGLSLCFFSILLGLAGSWLAVGRHLREIEPT